MVKTIAITGGIGSGKSTLAAMFRAYGYPVEDADILAREVLYSPEVMADIQTVFGDGVFLAPGELDRERVRDAILQDPAKRLTLESILHPAIAAAFQQKIDSLRSVSKNAWIVYEAALIFEKKRESSFDAVILVSASEAVRLKRLQVNRGMKEEDARRFMSAQLSDDEKKAGAHFLLCNEGSEADLEAQFFILLRGLKDKFSHSSS